MPLAAYKIEEARARFSELLARARAREEIVITKDSEPHARPLPPARRGGRETAPPGHLRLRTTSSTVTTKPRPSDRNDALGIWRGRPAAP